MIQPNSEAFLFANKMQDMIDKFYHFKRFLFSLNIMKIPLTDYVFNLQHNRDALLLNNKVEMNNSFFNNVNSQIFCLIFLIVKVINLCKYQKNYVMDLK